MQRDGADTFIEKCRVPKGDGGIRPLKVEIEEFKALVEILEEYSELKSSGVKPSKERIEQWEAKFKSFLLKLLADPQAQKVIQFFNFLQRKVLIFLLKDTF